MPTRNVVRNYVVPTLIAATMATASHISVSNAATQTHSTNTTSTNTTSTNTTSSWHNALPQSMRHPCPTEDSVNCYWDASSRGNHKGHSFVVRKVPGSKGMICVFYVKAADARKWDYCS